MPYSVDLQLPDADAEETRGKIGIFHTQLKIQEQRGPTCCCDPDGHRRWCFEDYAHANAFHSIFGGQFVTRP